VRKISGYREPSEINRKAFEEAVNGVAAVSRELFRELHSPRVKAKVEHGNLVR
jgi:hypothetical protein